MTLVKFRNMESPRQFGISTLFNEALDKFWSEQAGAWMPSANIKERNNGYFIELAAPGFDKNDFKIQLDETVLSISAEKKEEFISGDEKYTRKEFYAGAFKRQFTLPDGVNSDNIQANYLNGILQLSIPKMQQQEKKVKEISIA